MNQPIVRAEAVSTSQLTRWRPINEQSFVLNFEREQTFELTYVFGWTREKSMILGRAEGSFNKSVDKLVSYQRAKFCVEFRES